MSKNLFVFLYITACHHPEWVHDGYCDDRTNNVFCNWDGSKHQSTAIKESSIIGSGTLIIAPRLIGSSAIIAAGSILVDDVGDPFI